VARAHWREQFRPLPGVARVVQNLRASLTCLIFQIGAANPRSEVDPALRAAQIVARDVAEAPAGLQHHSVELLLPSPELSLSRLVAPLRAVSALVHEKLSNA
jgi:hypothetical protein